ncbi:MAG: nitroreductase [Aquabacterium sp.]
MLDTEQAVLARRSVRGFLAQPVAPSLLQRIFEAAQHAPSNCNTQPWELHVASGSVRDALRNQLVLAAQDPTQARPDIPFDGKYAGAFRERQIDAAVRLWAASGVARDDRAARARSFMRNYELFDAPHVAFLFMPDWCSLREAADCGMYLQTLMLLLTAHGLASCPQTALSMHPDLIRAAFGVDASMKLLCGLSFGYEDTAVSANACRTDRVALGVHVHLHG